jgi:Zn-dependent protease
MALSYKILSVFGIDIELHLFFIIFILAFLAINPLFSFILIIVFFFVTLHEISHSLVAKRNGIKVKKIILLPIGGMAMMDMTEVEPLVEIRMALAGPLFNFVVVYICLILAAVFNVPLQEWISTFLTNPNFAAPLHELTLFYIFYANLILGYFNLFVPAFPLDGGRIFRALLALRFGEVRATGIAKTVSLGIAGFLFMLGIMFGDIWILIIAFFIGFAALSEYESLLLHRTLMKIKLKDIMSTKFLLADPDESIKDVVDRMIMWKTTDALIETDKGIKKLDLKTCAAIQRKKWKSTKAGRVAKKIGHVSPSSKIELVLRYMHDHETDVVPVVYRKNLVGVIYKSDIERMARIVGTLGKR